MLSALGRASQSVRAAARSLVWQGPSVRCLTASARLCDEGKQQSGRPSGKRSMLDDVLKNATSQTSGPRNMRRGRGNGGGGGGGGGGSGGNSGANASGGGSGGRRQGHFNNQGSRGGQQHRQGQDRNRGGNNNRPGAISQSEAIKAFSDWQLTEIKKMQDEFKQQLETGVLCVVCIVCVVRVFSCVCVLLCVLLCVHGVNALTGSFFFSF